MSLLTRPHKLIAMSVMAAPRPPFRSMCSKAGNIPPRCWAIMTVVFAVMFAVLFVLSPPITLYDIHDEDQISKNELQQQQPTTYELFLDSFNFDDSVQNSSSSLRLRFDWTNLERRSALSQRFVSMQSNCSALLTNYIPRPLAGLGSDLHVYSQGLCNALEDGNIRLRTIVPWIWLDLAACANTTTTSAMTCYFPESELLCPNDHNLTSMQESMLGNITEPTGFNDLCPTVKAEYGIPDIRAATTEFLFTRVSKLVQREAERQLRIVFGANGTVPDNLITVNIRWGDKDAEMTLVAIDKYIDAVNQILEQRSIDSKAHSEKNEVNIFIATEDPLALQAFQDSAPAHWRIYVGQYFRQMLPFRNPGNSGNSFVAHEMRGKPGLLALGSLLVAMESNEFVLTTASNWSRLINELRRSVLDPRCSNCTRLIDLLPGEF